MSNFYTETISDNCTCRWTNYGDHQGWHLQSIDPQCPLHGNSERESE